MNNIQWLFVIFGLVSFFLGISITVLFFYIRRPMGKLDDEYEIQRRKPVHEIGRRNMVVREFETPFFEVIKSLSVCSPYSYPRKPEASPFGHSLEAYPVYGAGTSIWYSPGVISKEGNFTGCKLIVKFHGAKRRGLPEWFSLELFMDSSFSYEVFYTKKSTYLIDLSEDSYRTAMDMLRFVHIQSCKLYSR